MSVTFVCLYVCPNLIYSLNFFHIWKVNLLPGSYSKYWGSKKFGSKYQEKHNKRSWPQNHLYYYFSHLMSLLFVCLYVCPNSIYSLNFGQIWKLNLFPESYSKSSGVKKFWVKFWKNLKKFCLGPKIIYIVISAI